MQSMMIIRVLAACFIASSHAKEFLEVTPQVVKERLSEESIQNALLEEVKVPLGAGKGGQRLVLLEAILLPLYRALPKNEHGKLGHSTVRYALHRLFIMRHGWNIRSFRSKGVNATSSSPVGVLKGQVPDFVQELFERRLGEKGLGLHELAVLAATIEHLIHDDTVSKLESVLEVRNISHMSVLGDAQADEVLDTYMLGIITGRDVGTVPLAKIDTILSRMSDLFTGWSMAQEFVRRVRKNMTDGEHGSGLDFATLTKVVEAISEEYGSFQNIECQDIKNALVKAEDRGTGRVTLADFYKIGLDGTWKFKESVDYLRQNGVLDESNPNRQTVIIPNYLHAQSNCVSSSGFFSICCKDECEGLMGHLEEKLAAPEATPRAISDIITNLPSATTSTPRKLSATLSSRLDDIAKEHGGVVPLHGRLFAQWMHHAFPRECPYPNVPGTVSQQTEQEYISEGGKAMSFTRDEMMEFCAAQTTDRSTAEESAHAEDLLQWSPEEELLIVRPPEPTGTGNSIRASMRSLALFAAAAAFALIVVRTSMQAYSAAVDFENSKFMV